MHFPMTQLIIITSLDLAKELNRFAQLFGLENG